MTRLPSLGRRGEGWVVIQVALLWLLVAVAFGWNGAWDREARTVTTAIAGVLLLGGLFLAFRGVVDLRGALTPLPHPRVGAQLVDTGAYRLVRHPIYGGIVIAALGWGLFTASPPAIAMAFVLLGFFRLKSAREEAWLAATYAGYEAYRARTRRMLPFLY